MSITDDPRLLRQHITDLESRISQVTTEKASHAVPIADLGKLIRRALSDANAALNDEEVPVAISDLTFELKGMAGMKVDQLAIDFAATAPPEALSIIRFTVARVPEPPRE